MSVNHQETTSDSDSSDYDENEPHPITEEDGLILLNEFMKMADSMYRKGDRTHRSMKNAFLKTEECKVGGDVIMNVFQGCAELVCEQFKQGERTI